MIQKDFFREKYGGNKNVKNKTFKYWSIVAAMAVAMTGAVVCFAKWVENAMLSMNVAYNHWITGAIVLAVLAIGLSIFASTFE